MNGVITSSSGYYNRKNKKSPPPNYRKVYTTRPPPGFKIFDNDLHFRMHYGNGIMEEEIQKVKLRMRAAANAGGYSPLGNNKSFSSYNGQNRTKMDVKYEKGKKDSANGWAFDSVTVTNLEDNVSSKANNELIGRKMTIDRMNERRRVRKEEGEINNKNNAKNNRDPKGCFRQFANGNSNNESKVSASNESSCSIM